MLVKRANVRGELWGVFKQIAAIYLEYAVLIGIYQITCEDNLDMLYSITIWLPMPYEQ